MITDEFSVPSDEPVEEHDPTKVRRTKGKDKRPYIKHPCPAALDQTLDDSIPICRDGRVPGKRPGTTKQCPKCKGRGYIEIIYTRCTSFVSVMEERTQLERWKMRTTLVGVAIDHILLQTLMASDPDDRDGLDRIADEAFELGDGHLKARKGTDLHELTTYVDRGLPIPTELTDRDTGQVRPVTLQDRADLAAWVRIYDEWGFEFIGQEVFVVNDEYQIGGTYDRKVDLSPWRRTNPWDDEDLDDMHPCKVCSLPVILDLKTGRVDYGQGKIAQQLAVYANSNDYDPATGRQTPQDVCTHRGIVVHLPQGTGEAEVYVVDLEEAWPRVRISAAVRNHRRTEKSLMWPINSPADSTHP